MVVYLISCPRPRRSSSRGCRRTSRDVRRRSQSIAAKKLMRMTVPIAERGDRNEVRKRMVPNDEFGSVGHLWRTMCWGRPRPRELIDKLTSFFPRSNCGYREMMLLPTPTRQAAFVSRLSKVPRRFGGGLRTMNWLTSPANQRTLSGLETIDGFHLPSNFPFLEKHISASRKLYKVYRRSIGPTPSRFSIFDKFFV